MSWAILVSATTIALHAAGTSTPALAVEPPPENPGCETYGCLYEHCDTPHYQRRGGATQQQECAHGIAYQRLPDGPDGRRFVRVLWPGQYDSGRRPMWDQVAHCESTWRWQINNGNGFLGGLQFTHSTWDAYGGEDFADRADQAKAEQQIAVAERVAFYGWTRPDGSQVAPQGPGAWPRCGRYLSAPAA